MDSKKIIIIVLIVVAVIYVVFVTRGSLTADQPKRFSSDQAKNEAKNIEPPSWSETINNIFGGLQEKVVLNCLEKSPKNSERKCEKLPLGKTTIPAAKEPFLPFLGKATFRTVKLVLIDDGQATVIYTDKKGGNKIDNPQRFDLPNPKNESSKIESIVVLENGGTLEITCKGNTSCQVGQL
jgi:hypothetical protein